VTTAFSTLYSSVHRFSANLTEIFEKSNFNDMTINSDFATQALSHDMSNNFDLATSIVT